MPTEELLKWAAGIGGVAGVLWFFIWLLTDERLYPKKTVDRIAALYQAQLAEKDRAITEIREDRDYHRSIVHRQFGVIEKVVTAAEHQVPQTPTP